MKQLIRVSSFGKKDKLLLIDQETIRFGEKAVPKQEITGILYGISAIQFYRFPVGTRYYIGLKTPAEQADLILTSYLGIGDDYFQELFASVLEEIWEPVTDRIWDNSKDTLAADGVLSFGNCQLSSAGMLVTKGQAFTTKQVLIGWEDLDYEKKHDRLVLNSKSDPQVWTNLYFHDTWNIDILMALLDWLSQEGGLAELKQ